MKKKKTRYIGKIIYKSRYISHIFQKGEDGSYIKDALMYQDILKYSISHHNFKRMELYNWLVRHNTELINKYKDLSTRTRRYNKRIHDHEERLDRLLNELIAWGLVRISGSKTAQKIRKEVEVYSGHNSGNLILLLLEIMDIKKDTLELENNYQYFYELLISTLVAGNNAPYQSTVLRTFLTKLHDKKLFSIFVDYVLFVCNSNDRINSLPCLVNDVMNYMFDLAPEKDLFMDLWYESASELDSNGKEIFLHNIKLYIEQRFRNNTKGYSKEYEKRIFDYRANYNSIVLEGECTNCKESNIVILSHKDYKNWIRNNDVSGDIQKFDCTCCRSKNSCIIPPF